MGEAASGVYRPRAGAESVLHRATREGLAQLAASGTSLPSSLLREVRAALPFRLRWLALRHPPILDIVCKALRQRV